MKIAAALAVLTAALTLAAAASGEDTRTGCLDAAVSGQKLLKAGQLLEARASLSACAREECPALVRRDCSGWLAEDDAAVPTVVFAARDAQDRDVPGVQVRVDGQLIPRGLDGKEVPLNPGPHMVRFEREGVSPVEQSLVAREREKGRGVVARLDGGSGAPGVEPGPAASRPVPVSTFVLACAGVLAGATSAYFGLHALSERSSSCDAGGACTSRSDYDSIRTGYDVSTIALGVAVLAFGGALWTYLARPSIDVQVGVGSALVRWRLSF